MNVREKRRRAGVDMSGVDKKDGEVHERSKGERDNKLSDDRDAKIGRQEGEEL
jgi:hypothetical protein